MFERMKHLAIAVVAVVAVSYTHESLAQPDKPLPKEAAIILTKMNAEIITAKKKSATALNNVLREILKKGDLDAANAIKVAIKDLEIPKSQTTSVVGTWDSPQSLSFILEFTADGKALNRSLNQKGVWLQRGNIFEMHWDNGWRHVMSPEGNGFVGRFFGPNGETGLQIYVRKTAH